MFTKVFTFAFAVTGLALLFACSVHPVTEERVSSDRPPQFAKDLPEGCKLGPVARVDGAEIYAIIDPATPAETEFLTLDEAMEKKLCTVREVGEGGTVNTLKISNSGQKPIFCMAGDLVLGGQQDRILAESLVVAANTADQDIPVFCVEHGRWHAQEKDGAYAQTRSFKNSSDCGQVDLNVKKAALESRNQSVVWEEVARNNTKMNVGKQTESGTFRATFDDEAARAKIEKNFAAAQKLLGKGVVGFAVVCNGELVAMDVFESSGLCTKLSDKLLRSYVITGIGGGYESTVVQAGAQFDNNNGGVAPANPSSGIFYNNQEIQTRSARPTRVAGTSNADEVPPTETPPAPPAPVATTPNANTETKREYTKESVKYDCTDKKSGKVVQRSFLKR